MNLRRRSLADRDSLGVSLRGLCAAWSSGQQALGRRAWPPLLLFVLLLVLPSSLLTYDSARAQYKAQPAGKVPRIGLLDESVPDRARLDLWKAFQERMGDLGYLEGQAIIFERRWARGKSERVPTLAAELVGLRVDIMVTAGARAALAAKAATTTIPIVMALVGDPVGLKLVPSLARPGGNITGITSISNELSGKRLALVKELAPSVSRVAIVWDLGNPGAALAMREMEVAAKPLGVVLENLGVRVPNGVESAFSAMRREHAGAVIVIPSPPLFPERRRLAELALTQRLPLIAGSSEYAEAGGLINEYCLSNVLSQT